MRVLIVSVIVVVLDQISKFSVRYFFEYGREHQILGDWLRLTYIENPGMAFGIQFGGQKFFTIFAMIATVVIFIYIVRARTERLPLRLALALILGGAIGNLVDRFLYGKVVDFIDVGIGDTRWPIFNFADSAVTLGMIILISLVLFDKSRSKEDEKNTEVGRKKEVFQDSSN
ncbi:signal peptidase II [candidate division KSB1 bacterium]|nr:signal peptidase II [candidate division KSB1 bacterium]NIR68665.1 signal peptidase II [candidate division KSB1 bacterium]NIS27154.1 signal peptidase II [candidate division KSB1 bacterium]NIT74040.1 signal peptidase II [candidate division KSB1 bacterium]NIU27906.1 signal peptidase II [candidate division KSB1 bacterium]